MTRNEIERFLNGDCLVRYDGELYYFDCITSDGILIMRDINNDYRHDVFFWKDVFRNRWLYTAVEWEA